MAAAARSAASRALPSCGTPIGSCEVSRTHISSSVAPRSFSIATVTSPVGNSSEAARTCAPRSWISDISEIGRVGLRLLDGGRRDADALLELLVGLGQRRVRRRHRVVPAAVERRRQALLGLAQLLPGRLDRRLPLADLLERGVDRRFDLGDTGHPCSLLLCGTRLRPSAYCPLPAPPSPHTPFAVPPEPLPKHRRTPRPPVQSKIRPRSE